MPIEKVAIPEIQFDNLQPEDGPRLAQLLAELKAKQDEIIDVVNSNHP